MINRLLELSLQRLRDQRNIYAHTIVSKSLNQETYREMAGKVKGLEEAQEIIKNVYDTLVTSKNII